MTIPHKVLTVYPQIKNIFSKVLCITKYLLYICVNKK
jgi:hypothetical protein